MTDFIVTLCTCPDQTTAETIAHLLVDGKHAACVNILPGITSIYRWKDQMETAAEHLLVIKSKAEYFSAIENAIRSHHPYELPEIIAMPISAGHPEYLNWISTCHA